MEYNINVYESRDGQVSPPPPFFGGGELTRVNNATERLIEQWGESEIAKTDRWGIVIRARYLLLSYPLVPAADTSRSSSPFPIETGGKFFKKSVLWLLCRHTLLQSPRIPLSSLGLNLFFVTLVTVTVRRRGVATRSALLGATIRVWMRVAARL